MSVKSSGGGFACSDIKVVKVDEIGAQQPEAVQAHGVTKTMATTTKEKVLEEVLDHRQHGAGFNARLRTPKSKARAR